MSTPTPTTKAKTMKGEVDLLASCRAFLDIVGRSSYWKIPGSWAGSAYGSHPHGLIVDGIKFTDFHNVNAYCSIEITDGSGWSDNYSRDPRSPGDPHPRPIGGTAITAWRDGRWVKDEFRLTLETKVRAILEAARQQIELAKADHEANVASYRLTEQAKRDAAEKAALSRLTGAA